MDHGKLTPNQRPELERVVSPEQGAGFTSFETLSNLGFDEPVNELELLGLPNGPGKSRLLDKLLIK